MKPAISFIFVNFQSADLLGQSLVSLRSVADSQILAEYIIINNDPTERTLLDGMAQSFPTLRIVHQERNLGFGGANNVGSRLATGEVLFFINPDTQLRRANFQGLMRAFEFRPRAFYGMALVQASGIRERWSAGQFPNLWRILFANMLPALLSQPWQATAISKVDWVSGAAFAIRRDFFLSLGGFDSSYFLYFEDVDLARRATDGGAWVGMYPFIIFQHAGGRSHKSIGAKKQAYYAGQRHYFKKWRPRHEQFLLALAHKCFRIF